MRKCVNCGEVQNQFNFSAWVIKVIGSVVYSEDGMIESVSPLVSTTTIAIGKELDGHEVRLKCPNCGFEGMDGHFPQIRTCWLTGKEADRLVEFPEIGEKWVSSTAPFQEFIAAVQNFKLYAEPLTIGELQKLCAD